MSWPKPNEPGGKHAGRVQSFDGAVERAADADREFDPVLEPRPHPPKWATPPPLLRAVILMLRTGSTRRAIDRDPWSRDSFGFCRKRHLFPSERSSWLGVRTGLYSIEMLAL
jgi:hypothetical protein